MPQFQHWPATLSSKIESTPANRLRKLWPLSASELVLKLKAVIGSPTLLMSPLRIRRNITPVNENCHSHAGLTVYLFIGPALRHEHLPWPRKPLCEADEI
jgi:hypothetical protein